MDIFSDCIQAISSTEAPSKEETERNQQNAPEALNRPVSSLNDDQALNEAVNITVREYLRKDKGELSGSLYRGLLTLVEQPLLDAVLKHTRGNQLRAAKMLGISRGNFRKKMKGSGLMYRNFKD